MKPKAGGSFKLLIRNVMITQGLNLFIVDDNNSTVTALKHYLYDKFGKGITISTFSSGESCLEKVNKETDVVILDYYMEGKNGNEILKSIKELNPDTKVIMFSSNENIGAAIEAFRMGATDYVVKGEKSLKKISSLLHKIITAPVRILVREFGISKFLAIFLLVFAVMAIVVVCVLRATS
jgi:DNA-binding NtrC family response regulator